MLYSVLPNQICKTQNTQKLMQIAKPAGSMNNCSTNNIIEDNNDPLKTLSADYMSLFCNGVANSNYAFSDVVFSVEGKQVHAHKCILAARSSFFRAMFCKGQVQYRDDIDNSSCTNTLQDFSNSSSTTTGYGGLHQQQQQQQSVLHIPVSVVSYDVFVVLLQFLYSGQLVLGFQQGSNPACTERGCWHLHCSPVVDLALETLQAAAFFGLDQLSLLIQKHLSERVDKIAVDDVMRVLLAAKHQGLQLLWQTCSETVAKSGLAGEVLRRHLPAQVATEIEEIRTVFQHTQKRMRSSPSPARAYKTSRLAGTTTTTTYGSSCSNEGLSEQGNLIILKQQQGTGNNMINNHGAVDVEDDLSCSTATAPDMTSSENIHDMRGRHSRSIEKMQQALDAEDIELVRMMVMGEGLNLDRAGALHYAVENCSREVVKSLLELGVLDVNYAPRGGQTALHVACQMASPEMISVLLDHHASPMARSRDGTGGDTPLDVIRSLISANHGNNKQNGDHQRQLRLRLCLELLQSAAVLEEDYNHNQNQNYDHNHNRNYDHDHNLDNNHSNSSADSFNSANSDQDLYHIHERSSAAAASQYLINAAAAHEASLMQDWPILATTPASDIF